MAVMQVQRALIDDEISEKKAGLLLYSIQIAAANVAKTTFGQAKDEEMVTEVRDEPVEIREHKGRNLPLIHTEHTDLKTGEQISPRINTDQDEGVEKILPQSAEVYANRRPSAETHANLG
ncbi:MAG TPA: hypothetical protein VGP89_10880 [Candidatus Angelobacter sp.]|jgi:hypothetical protein|nr:hypothetical protein [Candidatus Angelobacter sp.]